MKYSEQDTMRDRIPNTGSCPEREAGSERPIERIDLHMHSTVSDGTDSPREILAKVKALGLDLFALTDHDAVEGSRELWETRSNDDPAFLTGAEFSCRDEGGKYHILGYGYDPDAAAIVQEVALFHSMRMEKVKARLDFLRDTFGFTFSEEDLSELLSMKNPGKPHIGNLMVKYGYAESRAEAINTYINKKKFPSTYIEPGEAIKAILASGGIPVLAHPAYGAGDDLILDDDLEKRVLHLMDLGLRGVEAYYSGFSETIQEQLLSIAERRDLYVTAGSDYHGTNKMIALGDTNLASTKGATVCLHRFLAEIRSLPGYRG